MSEEIDVFWRVARIKGKVAELEPFIGQIRIGTLPPPAFAFSEDAIEADQLAAGVLDGSHTEVSTPRSAFGGEDELPVPGDLGIVLDGGGHPRALIRTVDVTSAVDGGAWTVVERFVLVYPPRGKRVREPSPSR